MPVAPNILKLSDKLYWVVSVTVFLLPALVLATIVRDAVDPAGLAARTPGVITPPGTGAVIAAGLAGALPLAALVWTLWQMRGLFDRYRGGEILTPACATHLERIGKGLFAVALLGILAGTLRTLALTWGNPPGQTALSIGFGSDQLGALLAGAFVLVVGRVMRAAAEVAEENRGFV